MFFRAERRIEELAAAHAKAVKKLALLRTRIESAYYAQAMARLSR